MIVVKVELWSARTGEVTEIGRMYLANDDTTNDDPTRGDYSVAVCRRGSSKVPKPINPDGPKPTRTGEVKNYPRLAYNMWRLITRALLSAFPEEDNKATVANDTAGHSDHARYHRHLEAEAARLAPILTNEDDVLEVPLKCPFSTAWVGTCNRYVVKGKGYCDEHLGILCVKTGRQADHTCEHTSQFVCGVPLAPGVVHGHGYGL